MKIRNIFSIAKKIDNDFESVNYMNHIDQRTYNHHEMWPRQGKSHKWLNGYDAGFNSKQLPPTASAEYSEGYHLGCKDRLRENVPPLIKDGFSYGHGFKPDSQD